MTGPDDFFHASGDPQSISMGSAGNLNLPYFTQKSSCTREARDQCEYACMMPGGSLDLYCYEDCIYSIC